MERERGKRGESLAREGCVMMKTGKGVKVVFRLISKA